MTPRKKSTKQQNQPASTPRDAAKQPMSPSRIARIPALLRYILVVLISLSLSSVLFTLTSELTLDPLSAVGKHQDESWEDSGLVVWKGIELGLIWIMGLGVRDILSFTFLAHLPTYILLSSFYKLDPTATVTSFAIVALTPITPFLLLRKNPITRSKPTPPILQDRSISLYTSLAATSIFSLILYSSYATWLPAQLATHFVNIPDISATRAGPAGWPILFLTLVPAGWAAREFLFAAWARASAESEIEGKSRTSRDGEYLAYVLYRKTWGALGAGTRVLISRTVVLGVMILANTVVQLAGTVKGVDVVGAGVWGGVWAGAALVIGAAFGWMGAVDGDA